MTQKTKTRSNAARARYPFAGGPFDGTSLELASPPKVYIATKLSEDGGPPMKHVYRRQYTDAGAGEGSLFTEPKILYFYDLDATRLANAGQKP